MRLCDYTTGLANVCCLCRGRVLLNKTIDNGCFGGLQGVYPCLWTVGFREDIYNGNVPIMLLYIWPSFFLVDLYIWP